ncbi:MAG: hypothetical protein LBL86_07835 [Coriobacteriales bacterium]|jgi:hypothetical protein|nr:hypothetical protein [Coriobacteriales bacterium]
MSKMKIKERNLRACAVFALAIAMALTVPLGLAGCGVGGASVVEGNGAAQAEEVPPASEEVLNEKVDEDFEKPAKEEAGGDSLAGALSSSYADTIMSNNPIIEDKYVNHLYFGVCGHYEHFYNKTNLDVAVERAIQKAKEMEKDPNVDYKVHYIDLNSGSREASSIAMVNTFTKDKSQAMNGVVVRACMTSGVAPMTDEGMRYVSYDGTDLNAGAGGRYLYALEGRGSNKPPVKEVGIYIDKNSGEATRNGIKAQIFEKMSFNPFSYTWQVVCYDSTTGTQWDDEPDTVDLNMGAGGDYLYMAQRR